MRKRTTKRAFTEFQDAPVPVVVERPASFEGYNRHRALGWRKSRKFQELENMAKKIKVNIFDDLKVALQDAAAYKRGKSLNLRVTRIPTRPKPISARPKPISDRDVRRIRRTLRASVAP